MNRRELLASAAGSAFGSAIGAAGVFVVAKAITCTAEEACPGITADRPAAPAARVNTAIAELTAALRAAHPNATIGVTEYRMEGAALSFAFVATEGGANAVAYPAHGLARPLPMHAHRE